MSATHEGAVVAQFGPLAPAYVESAVHAQGADLEALQRIVRECAPTHALDLGAGGGHIAYRIARYAGAVTSYDLSSEMLAAVAATTPAPSAPCRSPHRPKPKRISPSRTMARSRST